MIARVTGLIDLKDSFASHRPCPTPTDEQAPRLVSLEMLPTGHPDRASTIAPRSANRLTHARSRYRRRRRTELVRETGLQHRAPRLSGAEEVVVTLPGDRRLVVGARRAASGGVLLHQWRVVAVPSWSPSRCALTFPKGNVDWNVLPFTRSDRRWAECLAERTACSIVDGVGLAHATLVWVTVASLFGVPVRIVLCAGVGAGLPGFLADGGPLR